MTGDGALARATDPRTSWAAAVSVDTATAADIVEAMFNRYGAMTDNELNDYAREAGYRFAHSSLRSRRAERTRGGTHRPGLPVLYEDSGERVTVNGRAHIVWRRIKDGGDQ